MNFKQRETARIEALTGSEKEAAMNELIYKRIMCKIVVRENGCWEFMGARAATGYGHVGYNRKRVFAHRFLLARQMGKPLGDLHACHKRDNPPCCNPDHLFAGTDKDNFMDCAAKNRHANKRKTHCKQGHEYTEENTRMVRSKLRGEWKRQCKRCGIVRMRVNAGWPKELAESMPLVKPRGRSTGLGNWSRQQKPETA